MSLLELTDVTKIYADGTKAVDQASLVVSSGELIVFVGPSGCGKSSLLRMIAGLEELSGGDIILDGSSIVKVDPAERDIAMVFQNYALYPHMNVFKNIAYGLKNRGIGKVDIEERVNQVSRLLDIGQYLNRKPGQLSGGQRQRVAMARAIARDPKVFLFDEPLSNLDAKLRLQVRLEIKKLQRKMKVTSIFVTHDQVEAMTLGDRLVVINNGKIEQIGTPLQVYNNPCSKFVADFIGTPSMNFLEGSIEAGIFSYEDFQCPVQCEDCEFAIMGVRPEDCILSNHGKIKVSGDLLEELGSDRYIYGQEGAGNTFCVKLSDVNKPLINEIFHVDVNPNKLHFFNGKTGERLGEN